MKKRLCSAILALALCLALPFPALAEEETAAQTYEEAVAELRNEDLYAIYDTIDTELCTVFLYRRIGTPHIQHPVVDIVYKNGVVVRPDLSPEKIQLSGDGTQLICTGPFDPSQGTNVYTVDLASGEIVGKECVLPTQEQLFDWFLDHSTEERRLEGAEDTVLLFSSDPSYWVGRDKEYFLYLICREPSQRADPDGWFRRLVLPSTTAVGEEYPQYPTHRAPDEMYLNGDGSVLTYVYRFDDTLSNANGEILHDAGIYTYRVDTATGELKVDFEKGAGAEGTTFVDVSPSDWFAPYVNVCVEEGLLNGVGEGRFDPQGVLNGDEALVMAARVLLKANGETEFPKGPDAQGFWDWAGWYKGLQFDLGNSVAETQSYVDSWCWDPLFYLAQAAGPALFSEGVTYACSRNTFFKALAFASQGFDLPADNDISAVPGTRDEDILRLYRAGILSGIDQSGSFAGQRNLTRAEAAAALARIVRPELRMSFQPSPSPSPSPYQGYTLTPLMDVESSMENYPVATIFYLEEDYRQAGGILTLDGRLVDYPEGGRIYSSGVSRSYDYIAFSVVDDQWNYKSWLIGQDGHYVPGSGKYQHLSATGDGHFLASQSRSDGEVSHTSWYLLAPDGTVETELPETLGGSGNNWYGFSEGVCPREDEKTGLWGYVDAQGNWVMEPTWAYASAFEGGYAILDDDQGQCAVIDRGGNFVIPFQGKWLTLPQSSPGYEGAKGLLYWEDWRMNKGLMDLNGTVYSLPDTVSSPVRYYNGYASVYDEAEGGTYYLDSSARRVSETFDRCGDLTPDGQGFVELGGRVYRIQFERK